MVAKDVKKGLGVSALHMPNEDFDMSEALDYGNAAKKEVEYRIDGIPEFNKSRHTIDIKEQDLVQLNIDLDQRGVAGDNSWGGKPQEEYIIKGDVSHSYTYFLIPFEQGNRELFMRKSKKYND